jgi:hypothetical protein
MYGHWETEEQRLLDEVPQPCSLEVFPVKA